MRFALRHRIEDAEIRRRIGARPCDPLPAGRIVGGVGIDQRIPEPGLADPPVDQQILGQEGRSDHAHAVVHPAGAPEFAHAGIDDGNARAPLLPGRKRVGVCLRPGKRVETRLEVACREIALMEEEMPGEFAPADLRLELGDRALDVRRRRLPPPFDRMPDLERADLAEAQMRREARGRLRDWFIAMAGIAGEPRCQEVLQARRRAGLAGRPGLAETTGPVGMARQQAPVVERFAASRLDRLGPRAGCGQGLSRRLAAHAGAPERREDAEGLVALGAHRPGFEKKIRLEALDRDALLLEAGLERGVDRSLAFTIAAVPVNGLRSEF